MSRKRDRPLPPKKENAKTNLEIEFVISLELLVYEALLETLSYTISLEEKNCPPSRGQFPGQKWRKIVQCGWHATNR